MLFYSLGIAFFAAYALKANNIGGQWPSIFFEVFDLAFIFITFLYGGTSLHLSLRNKDTKAIGSAIFICLTLGLLFAYLFALNYWEVFNLPTSGASGL